VRLSAGQQGHRRRLGDIEMRQLQQGNQKVFRTKLQMKSFLWRGVQQLLLGLLLAHQGAGLMRAQTPDDPKFLSTLGELSAATFEDKDEIVKRLSQTGHPNLRAVLTALLEDRLYFRNDDQKVFLVKSGEESAPTLDLIDPLSLKSAGSVPVE